MWVPMLEWVPLLGEVWVPMLGEGWVPVLAKTHFCATSGKDIFTPQICLERRGRGKNKLAKA